MSGPASSSAPSGVVVVDKPSGPTSHDVVGRVRRALGMKRVGHGGTLDPMASGVLVVLVGEATKLAGYLTAQEKRYRARVVLGASTDTLDAEGDVVARAEVPAWLRDAAAAGLGGDPRIEAALDGERARRTQVPPAFSAIQVDGRRSYDRARAGEEVELAPRDVCVRSLALAGIGLEPGPRDSAAPSELLPYLDVELEVSKGYYVRSLARDLGEALLLPAHLSALRRTASGPFTLAEAVPLDAGPERLRAALRSAEEAARAALPVAVLTEPGTLRARQGKRLEPADFSTPPRPVHGATAWLDPTGRLVAIGDTEDGVFTVRRGFTGLG